MILVSGNRAQEALRQRQTPGRKLLGADGRVGSSEWDWFRKAAFNRKFALGIFRPHLHFEECIPGSHEAFFPGHRIKGIG